MVIQAFKTVAETQISLVVFSVAGVNYAIEIGHVREILTPAAITVLPHMPPGLVGVVDHRGEVVPILDLRARFAVPTGQVTAKKAKWVLVEIAGRSVGFIVDDVFGVQHYGSSVFRQLPQLGTGEDRRAIASVTMQDGRMVFVLDMLRFESLTQGFAYGDELANMADQHGRVNRE